MSDDKIDKDKKEGEEKDIGVDNKGENEEWNAGGDSWSDKYWKNK